MDQLIEQLVLHEGLLTKPYRCGEGRLTIGVGRNLDDKGITKAEALYLLDNDIYECSVDLLRIFPSINQMSPNRKIALIDLRFNLGPEGFRAFILFRSAVERADWGEAAKQLRNSKWFAQVQPTRSALIIKQILEG